MSNLTIKTKGMSIDTLMMKMVDGEIDELDTLEARIVKMLKGQIRDPGNRVKNRVKHYSEKKMSITLDKND